MSHLNIMVSKHSVFYSPLIAVIAGGFLEDNDYDASYSVVPEKNNVSQYLLSGEMDIAQAAVSANWSAMEKKRSIDIVHFAEINQRDGFFLLGRGNQENLQWKDLEGCSIIAEQGGQPFFMLRFALNKTGVDFNKIKWIDGGTLDSSIDLFRQGTGDFIHAQGPYPQQLTHDGFGEIVFSVGDVIGPVAFSSISATSKFIKTDSYPIFLDSFKKAKKWVLTENLDLVTERISPYFKGISDEVVKVTLNTYRKLGCWSLDTHISRKTYESSLDVFLFNKAISKRHLYSEVVYCN